MIVLSDNDVLIKLSSCDLFLEFLTAFEVSEADVLISPRIRFSIGKSKAHRNRIGEDSFARLNAFLAKVADILVEPDSTFITALNEHTDKNIDAGEAALFAVCPLIPNSVILTGDKKSLTDLTEAGLADSVCETLCRVLAGRVICFEQVLVRILDHFGFDAIRERLIAGRECDRGLALWLGSGLDANETRFRDGVSSFLKDARDTSGSLLAK